MWSLEVQPDGFVARPNPPIKVSDVGLNSTEHSVLQLDGLNDRDRTKALDVFMQQVGDYIQTEIPTFFTGKAE